MKKWIYVVTSGDYSDKALVCAFTDRHRAQAYCRERNAQYGYCCDEYRVEVLDVDPALPSEVKDVREEFKWTRTTSTEEPTS